MRKKQFTLKNFFFFFFWFSVVILHNNFWDSRTYVVLGFFKLKYGIIQEGCIFCQQNVCMRLNDTQSTVHRGLLVGGSLLRCVTNH